MNSLMESPCEPWGEILGGKIGICEIFSYRIFLMQKPNDLEIARGQNLFFRCSFFQSECVLKAVGQRNSLEQFLSS